MEHAEHDDVYQQVFATLGTQKAESYESLAKVLPSIKDGLAEAKELVRESGQETFPQRHATFHYALNFALQIAMKVLREMKKPQMDRLRAEYEEAAAQEDADDLSTEEGDWVDASGAADEDLDDEGIPVVKLTRPSSSFILDGPGDVKVDNFTPEGETGAEACTSTVAPADTLTATGSSTSKADVTSSYVPSIITRVSAAVPGLTTGAGAVITTLEDVVRAMRGTLPSADAPVTNTATLPDTAASSAGPPQSVMAKAGRSPTLPPDNEDPEVIIMEAPSAPAPMLVPAPSASGAGGVCAPSRLDAGAGGCDDNALSMATAARNGDGSEDGSALPGACADTSAEDAVWAAMQGVDGAALLEHMGLSGERPQPASDGSEGNAGEGQQEPLANGHAHLEAPGNSSGGGGAGSRAAGGGAVVELAACQAAVQALGNGEGSGSGNSTAIARRTTASTDGPTFEVVEAFSLDPDFDYDNVELTPREFPYTMLNMRGAGGQVPPGAQQRR